MDTLKLNENLEAMYHLALRLEEIMREIEARAIIRRSLNERQANL